MGEGFAIAFEGELAGAVIRLKRDPDQPAEGTDKHNTAALALPHRRQGRLDEADGTPEVRFDLVLRLRNGGLLDRSGQSPAGAGHDGVETTVLGPAVGTA